MIVPVVEAIVVWFILNALARGIRRIPGLGPRLPFWVALLISALVIIALGLLVVRSTIETVAAMGPQAAGLQDAFDPIFARVADLFGVDARSLIDNALDSLGLEAAVRLIVVGMLGLVSHSSVVAIYVGFLIVDQQFFDAKLRALVPDPGARARSQAMLRRLADGIQTYLLIMTIVSVLTAGLSYLILIAVGAQHAFFIASLIFLLNFIPTIGSIIGTVLPAIFVLAQFQLLGPALTVLAAVGVVQFVIGNIVLPRMAGGSLNISLFVTILALFLFGAVWGVTGMFVAMPLTAMLIIVFGNFEATRPIAILLSRTGEIETIES